MTKLRFFVFWLLSLSFGFAWANYPAWNFAGGLYIYASKEEACESAAAAYSKQFGGKWVMGSVTLKSGYQYTYTCTFKNSTTGSTAGGSDVATTSLPGDPPPGWGNPCSDKNLMLRAFIYKRGPFSAPTHVGQCVVDPVSMASCTKLMDETTQCWWYVKRTGEVWTGVDVTDDGAGTSDTAPPPIPPNTPATPAVPSPPMKPPRAPTPDICSTCVPCPKGTVQGGIGSDGVPMCMGTGTNPPAANPGATPTTTVKPPTTTTDANGGTTTVQQTVQNNSDGSTTTTTNTTVKAPDGTQTTSQQVVVGNTSSGVPGKTDLPPSQDQKSMCKENPNLAICRDSSVTGSCGQIACSGDAIQCATLRAAVDMQCRQKADEDALKASPQKALGDQILNGNDPLKGQIDIALKGSEVDLSKPNLDSTGFLGGGACIADKTITVMGKPVVMQFSSVCSNIQPLRGAVLACAFIIAYLIVARSVLSA